MMMRGRLRKTKWLLAGLVVLALGAWGWVLYPFWGLPFNAERHGAPPITPAWALECWVWEDDANTAASTRELLEDYKKNDFPVRTVLIDSPWSTRYNDFEVDQQRFPDPGAFFRGLQDDGYRVVLWMTSMVNSESKDTAKSEDSAWFQSAADQGFLINYGEKVKWWKGRGGSIDYANPEAIKWWRGMQNQVLEWGVDGWKLDGTDPYALSWLGKIPFPYVRTHEGWMSSRRYADHYYRDEYHHGLEKNPEFITLARSIDSPMPWSHPEGYAPIDSAPVTWVGDNQHTWNDADRGLERALKCILRSAELGYNVIGSDVAGYHGAEPIPPEIYIRWAQFSTFCGLFLNGGHGERRMSFRSPEELSVIRKFSWLHTELVPYMYSHGVEAHEGARPLMRPLKGGDYHYLFGNDFLVAPFHEPGTQRTVHLPEGEWRYLFDDRELISGPTVLTRDFSLQEFPVYVREGAVIPMRISREYTGIGQNDWEGQVVWNLYPKGKTSFTLHHPDESGIMIATCDALGAQITVTLEGVVTPHILRIYAEKKPSGIECNGAMLEEGKDWEYREAQHRVIVRSKEKRSMVYVLRN